MAEEFKQKSSIEVYDFLLESGIPDVTCHEFEDQEIDGEAFLELTESDVGKLTDKMGIAKKIIRLITHLKEKPQPQPQPVVPIPSTDPALVTPPRERSERSWRSTYAEGSFLSPRSPISPASDDSGSAISSVSSVSTKGKQKGFQIPEMWRPSIMACIQAPTLEEQKRKLVPSVRSEIVRDLVTQMYAFCPRPDKDFIERVAKKLVQRYPFMKDQGKHVTGYGSWEKKMLERVANSRKRAADSSPSSPPAKRGRPKLVSMLSRYPPISQDGDASFVDETALERHMNTLKTEMDKESPRKEQILSLMKLTYAARRERILSDSADISATALEEFAALSMIPVLQQEIDLILAKKDVVKMAMRDWQEKWVQAISSYAGSVKNKAVATAIKSADTEFSGDDEAEQKTALILLCTLLGKPKEAERLYIYEDCKMTETPETVARRLPLRTAPRIAGFKGPTTDSQYYIIVEQKVLCSVTAFSKALMLWFVSHYIFNLEYCKQAKDVALFMQEFGFGLPTRDKKSGTYLSVTTGIQSYD